MEDFDWKLYSWVLRGKQRRLVLQALSKPKIPTEIRKDTKLSITHVSKVLKAFTEKGITKCLTPDVKIGKIYGLTKKGEKIREEMLRKD